MLRNNLKLSQIGERYLIIDAKVGKPGEGRGTKDVGLFMFLVDKIEKYCPSDQSWIDASDCLESNDSGFASSIRISARKSKVEREYIKAKRVDALRELKSLVDYIEKFNNDPHCGSQLSANVCGIGGFSLLHAALHLSGNPVLIQKLLVFGADPKGGSTPEGSPLALAKRLLQRARMKVKMHKEKGATTSDLAPYEARLAMAEQVFRILQLHEPAVNTKKVSFAK